MTAPPGRPAQGVLRRDDAATARVRLTCPAAARVTCRGTLQLRRTTPPRRVLRRATYAVTRGDTGEIVLSVPASLVGGRARLETDEKGVSRKGPRGVGRSVRVR